MSVSKIPKPATNSALPVRSSLLDPSQILARLDHAASELVPLVTDAIVAREGSKLGVALREGTAVRTPPSPDEALALLAVFLVRNPDLGKLHALGAATIVQRLEAADETHDAGPRLRGLAQAISSSVPAFEGPEILRSLGVSVDPAPVPTETSHAALKAVGVARVPSSAKLGSLSMSGLAVGLSYGSGAVFETLDRLISEKPNSALVRSLAGLLESRDSEATPALRAAQLARLLSNFSQNGSVPLSKLEGAFGVEGRELAGALAKLPSRGPTRPNYAFLAECIQSVASLMPARPAMELIDALVRNDELIPKSLPALDAVKSTAKGRPLEGKGLIAAQHLFPTIVPLLESFVEKGMNPSDIHVLGTPYTPNPLVVAYCRLKGMDVRSGVDLGGATRAFEENRKLDVQRFVDRVAAGPLPAKGFKILDDGGMLNQAVTASPHLPKALGPLEGVEQTTRGLTELASCELSYPVVTVANARAKKVEGDMIGWSLARSLLDELGQTGKSVHTVSVVSAGTVGVALAQHLREAGFEVTLVDLDGEKRARAESLGFKTTSDLRKVLDQTDLVFSCTGKRALNGRLLEGYRGLVASGSSAAIEFDQKQVDSYQTRGALFLNRGRPLNFSGDGYENLTKNQIGLTRALLFSAVVQPHAPGTQGLVPLDDAIQDVALSAWKASGGDKLPALSKQAPALSAPDQGGLASHAEWMSYFSSSGRPVCPQPNQSQHLPGPYFYQDEQGKVRVVDTRHGKSSATALPQIPLRVMATESPLGSSPVLVETESGGQRFVRTLSGLPKESKLGQPIPIDALSTWYTANIRPEGVNFGVAFQSQKEVVVLHPGATELERIPLSLQGPSFFAWPSRGLLMQFRREPPALVTYRIGGQQNDVGWSRFTLPSEFRSLEAFAEAGVPIGRILIGRDEQGRVLISNFAPSFSAKPMYVLPEGAEFRGFRPDPEDAMRFWIDYLPAGKPDELGSLEQIRFDMVGGFSKV